MSPSQSTPSRSGNFKAYVVFRGSQVGAFSKWRDAQVSWKSYTSKRDPQLEGIIKGYDSLHDACMMFKLGSMYGLVDTENVTRPTAWPTQEIGSSMDNFRVPEIGDTDEPDVLSLMEFLSLLPGNLVNLASAKVKATPRIEDDSDYYVIIRGRYPGVVRGQISALAALGSSSKATSAQYSSRAEANEAFVSSFMSSTVIGYDDDGRIRRYYGPDD